MFINSFFFSKQEEVVGRPHENHWSWKTCALLDFQKSNIKHLMILNGWYLACKLICVSFLKLCIVVLSCVSKLSFSCWCIHMSCWKLIHWIHSLWSFSNQCLLLFCSYRLDRKLFLWTITCITIRKSYIWTTKGKEVRNLVHMKNRQWHIFLWRIRNLLKLSGSFSTYEG